MTNPFQNPFTAASPSPWPIPPQAPVPPPRPAPDNRVRKAFGWVFLVSGGIGVLAAQSEWAVPRQAISMTLFTIALLMLGTTMVWKPLSWRVAGPAIGAVLVLSIIVSPPSTTRRATDAPTATSERSVGSTSTTSADKRAPVVLPAVPVGRAQHIVGQTEDGRLFESDVTVIEVVRTSDTEMHIEVTVKVTEGSMPLGEAWRLEQKRGASVSGNTWATARCRTRRCGRPEGPCRSSSPAARSRPRSRSPRMRARTATRRTTPRCGPSAT